MRKLIEIQMSPTEPPLFCVVKVRVEDRGGGFFHQRVDPEEAIEMLQTGEAETWSDTKEEMISLILKLFL